MALKGSSCGGERRASLVTNEQLCAERFLKALNARTHRRLRDVQTLCRIHEATGGDDYEECACEFCIHGDGPVAASAVLRGLPLILH